MGDYFIYTELVCSERGGSGVGWGEGMNLRTVDFDACGKGSSNTQHR